MATVKNSPVKEDKKVSYVEYVSNYPIESKGFQHSLKASDSISSAVEKYREVLSKEVDGSVVIVSVGFFTNLHQLLHSLPDKHSNLCGKELVKKKVKFLSAMGGDFRENQKKGEFNIRYDIQSAKCVFEEWPTDILLSTWEVGAGVVFPGSKVLGELDYNYSHHPLILAYEYYLPMPYDRETWDLTSILVAIEPFSEYFDVSQRGRVTVDDAGFTTFKENVNGNCHYLILDSKKNERVLNRFVQLIKQTPSNIDTNISE